jgi:hypothetical protein
MLNQQPRASRALPSARVPRLSTANNDGSTCRELRFMSAWSLDEAVEQLERAEKLEGADERRRLDSPLLSRFERGQIGLSPRRLSDLPGSAGAKNPEGAAQESARRRTRPNGQIEIFGSRSCGLNFETGHVSAMRQQLRSSIIPTGGDSESTVCKGSGRRRRHEQSTASLADETTRRNSGGRRDFNARQASGSTSYTKALFRPRTTKRTRAGR